MIADLCHYSTPTQAFTGLNLVRDSYGLKTNGKREKHIQRQRDPRRSHNVSQQRRHIEEELRELEVYVEKQEEIEAGDHHDPTALELYCEMEPGAPECKTREIDIDVRTFQ